MIVPVLLALGFMVAPALLVGALRTVRPSPMRALVVRITFNADQFCEAMRRASNTFAEEAERMSHIATRIRTTYGRSQP